MKHVFAVCAYGESPYLESCIRSLLGQSVRPEILLCTSTPSAFLREIAARYGLPLFVRDGASSLKEDWNFAVETAVGQRQAELVTLAHQDDVYHRDYLKVLLRAAALYPDLLLFCTRYRTIGADGAPFPTFAERVKRFLRLPLRLRRIADRRLIKRLPLLFGNGIGCPSCSYRIAGTGLPLFREDARFVLDWLTLLRLADLPGRFVCAEKELLDYRVHEGAETRRNIADHNREREELKVFSRLWPAPVPSVIMFFYKLAYRDYR